MLHRVMEVLPMLSFSLTSLEFGIHHNDFYAEEDFESRY